MAARSSKFTSFFFTYLSLFLIVPKYSNDKFYNTTLSKIQGVCLISAKLALNVVAITSKSVDDLFRLIPPSERIVYSITNITLLSFTLMTIIKCSFFDVKNWTILFDNYTYWNSKIGQNSNLFLKFAFKHVMFLLFMFNATYGWSVTVDLSMSSIVFTTSIVEMYYEYLLIMLWTHVIDRLRCGYVHLNAKLSKWSLSPKFIFELRNLTQDYRLLGEATEIYNDLFGFQLILILFHCGGHAITALNFILTANAIDFSDPFFYYMVLCNLSVFIFTFVRILTLYIGVIIFWYCRQMFRQLSQRWVLPPRRLRNF